MSVFSNPDNLPFLRVSTSPRLVVVRSEPMVLVTRRGYQPIVLVKDVHDGKDYIFFISAQSVTEPLEGIRQQAGKLDGAEIMLKKESEDRMSRYVVSVM